MKKGLFRLIIVFIYIATSTTSAHSHIRENTLRSISTLRSDGVGELRSGLLSSPKARMNITPKVWERLKGAVAELNKSIKQIDPEAEIVTIRLTSCALTRGVMISGSDIDDMYIYIRGLDGKSIASLEDRFISWLRIDGLNLNSANAKPQLICIDSLGSIEGKFRGEGKRRVLLYEDGNFRPSEVLLRESGMGHIEFLKYVARIRMLLLIGELSPEDVKTLISDENQTKLSIRILRDTVDNHQRLKLTEAAKELIFALDKSLLSPNRIFVFKKEKRKELEEALYELCEKELIYIYKEKIILGWRAHSPRWSDSFWSCQAEIIGENTDREAGFKLINAVRARLEQKIPRIETIKLFDSLSSQNKNLAERACIQITEEFSAAQIPPEIRRMLIEKIGQYSIFASAAVMDFIKENMRYFKDDLLEILSEKLKDKRVKKMRNREALVSHYIIRLLPALVFFDERKADEIAKLLYEAILSSGEMPEFLVYYSIDCLVKINEYIEDENIRELIKESIRPYQVDELPWIREVAHRALLIMDISSQIEVANLEKAVRLLGNSPVIVAYNKGVMHTVVAGDRVEIGKAPGAIATPLYSLLEMNRGGIVISSAMTDVEKCIARAGKLVKVGENIWAKYILHPEEEFEKFYNRFANPVVWLMHHQMLDRLTEADKYGDDEIKGLVFNEETIGAYVDYKSVNERFSYEISKLTDVIPQARIFLHDYHIYLTAKAMRQRKPRLYINHFIHVPWPSAEYLRNQVPEEIIKDMLESLLCNDRIGFHIRRYADNFMESCAKFLGADCDYDRNIVSYKGRETFIQTNPLSWNYSRLQDNMLTPKELELAQTLREKLPGKIIIARGGRTDLTKGILEGFVAFREFLRRYPEFKNRVGFAAWLVPGRLHIPQFKKMMDEVKNTVISINREFSPDIEWNGVIETEQDWQEALFEPWPTAVINLMSEKPWFGLCAASDIALVNSLRDGMNLVVKDFAVLNDPDFLDIVNQKLQARYKQKAIPLNPAVIIASENMGAYDEVKDGAIGIDPFNLDEIVEALHKAVIMSVEERKERASKIARQASRNTLSDWIKRSLGLEGSKVNVGYKIDMQILTAA